MRFGWMAATVAIACAPADAAQIISVNVADGVLFNSNAYRVGNVTFGNVSALVLRENGTISVGNNQVFSANYDPDWERFFSITLYGEAGTDLQFGNLVGSPYHFILQISGLQTITLPGYAFSNTSGFRVTGNSVRVAAFAISVPEPATWAMLIAGFGAIGATLRRCRSPNYRWS